MAEGTTRTETETRGEEAPVASSDLRNYETAQLLAVLENARENGLIEGLDDLNLDVANRQLTEEEIEQIYEALAEAGIVDALEEGQVATIDKETLGKVLDFDADHEQGANIKDIVSRSSEEIKAAQEALDKAGFQAGTFGPDGNGVDGLAGASTLTKIEEMIAKAKELGHEIDPKMGLYDQAMAASEWLVENGHGRQVDGPMIDPSQLGAGAEPIPGEFVGTLGDRTVTIKMGENGPEFPGRDDIAIQEDMRINDKGERVYTLQVGDKTHTLVASNPPTLDGKKMEHNVAMDGIRIPGLANLDPADFPTLAVAEVDGLTPPPGGVGGGREIS